MSTQVTVAVSSALVSVTPTPGGISLTIGPFPTQGVPSGGTTSQVLGKLSGTDGDFGWIDQSGGGGGGAPTSAQYLTLATSTGLSAERVFTVGSGLTATDAGANNTYTVAVDFAAVASASALSSHAGLTTTAHGGIVASSDPRLSDARTPTAHTHAATDITSGVLAPDRLATGTGLQVLRRNTGNTALEFATLSIGGGDALVANGLGQFAATTSASLAGVISDETGSGSLVFATSPSLTTPALGAATATSINGLTITTSTGTLTITNAKTLSISNTLTLTATDGSTLAIGTGGTLGTAAYTASTDYCLTGDSRLTNARTPTAHAASHQNGGGDEIATATAAANAIPKAGAGGTLAMGWIPTGTSSSTVCIGNDSRLSDSRAPSGSASGDLTGTYPGPTVAAGVITLAKMANLAQDQFIGRVTASTGVPETATITAAGRALIDDTDAAAQRTTLGLGSLATQSGTFSGTSSGTNTGDQTITLTGNVTGSGTGSFAATLATAQPAVHTWALAQTFTVAPVFTDQSGTRTALGLGSLATQSGTFSGTSSGTNTGDQTITLTGDATGTGTGSFAVTVAKINGATLSTTTATSGNILIGSGTAWVTQAISGDFTITSGGVATIANGAVTGAKMATAARTKTIRFKFYSGDAANTTDQFLLPWAATITKATIFTDATISAVIDVKTGSTPTNPATLCGGTKPTLSSSSTPSSTNIAGWTTALTAGNYLQVNLDSVTWGSATYVELDLEVTV